MAEHHPRTTVNQVCLPRSTSLTQDLAALTGIGVARVGLDSAKVQRAGAQAPAIIGESGLTVDYLLHRSMFELPTPSRWASQQQDARSTIDLAAGLGVGIVYLTTGGGGELFWDEAADRFCTAVGPVVEYGASLGVRMLIETTNPAFADLDILHTFRDTRDLAERTGLGVCLDVHASWTEPQWITMVSAMAAEIGLVQISDYRPGSRTMDRSIPGTGVVPIRRVVAALLENGFTGQFDLELFGDQGIDDLAAITAGLDYLDDLLSDLGA